MKINWRSRSTWSVFEVRSFRVIELIKEFLNLSDPPTPFQASYQFTPSQYGIIMIISDKSFKTFFFCYTFFSSLFVFILCESSLSKAGGIIEKLIQSKSPREILSLVLCRTGEIRWFFLFFSFLQMLMFSHFLLLCFHSQAQLYIRKQFFFFFSVVSFNHHLIKILLFAFFSFFVAHCRCCVIQSNCYNDLTLLSGGGQSCL